MVTHIKYIPERGDIVWLTFSPTKGHEQMGRRPALVLSDRKFNKNHLAFVVPITNVAPKYETHLSFVTTAVSGSVLCDQVRSLDWAERDIEYITTLPENVVHEVQNIIISLILSS